MGTVIAVLMVLAIFGPLSTLPELRGRRRTHHRSRPTPPAPSSPTAPRPTGGPSLPADYPSAKVGRILDGDTVDISLSGRRTRIRLDAIDCPEDGQPWGDTARYGLIKLIGGKDIRLEVHGTDVHGRTLATLYVWNTAKANG
ncbi:MAG: thermonuclease family protein [Pseudomonadota bacterium]